MRLPLVALMLLPLAGCVGSPAEGPMDFWRNVTGDPLQGRLPPPGMDSKEYPNLASVPPAPARGAASAREELSRALMEARTQSNQPLVPGTPVPPPPAGSGSPVPMDAPPPPRLAAAPRIAPGTSLPLPGPRNNGAVPAPDAPAMPADPGMAPALPPAEMLAPPPPMPRL